MLVTVVLMAFYLFSMDMVWKSVLSWKPIGVLVIPEETPETNCGFTMLGLLEGLRQIDPDAVRAAFWLMHAQSGVPCDIDRVNFKIVDFADALNEATAAEQAIIAEANEGDPKETPDQ